MRQPTLAIFTKNRTNPAYAAARIGADRVAKAVGAHTRHYVPKKPDDVAEQIALIDRALASRPDAVVLVPVHPTAINASIRKIVAAGVPLIGFLNRYSEPGPISFVGSDDYALAVRIATSLYEHLHGRGRVLIVEGPRESVTSLDRVRGFRDAQKSFPGITFAGTICGEYQRKDTIAAMHAFVRSNVPFDAVIAANDVMALATIEVMDETAHRSVVTGVNAVPDAIAAIKAGKLLATVDFDAMKITALATEAALRHLQGEAVPTEITLPVQIVDASNCQQWDKPFEERELVSWEDALRARSAAAT